ncbi:MAG: hypothetical protein JRE43_07805 [Deltaproteobacteria bacterium]|nr:hypothetical protein [Deltaproteobacteria bacterium]MBW2542801.1 hypothetical protein [Deltaproteobacteria bacterium]
MTPRTRLGLAVLSALLVFAVPARADEIEPEPETAPLAETEPEPAPPAEPELEPEPEAEPVEVSEDEYFREPGWIPSIETGFETFDYNVDTTVVNSINPPAWQGAQSEAERQLMVRIGGELMGPEFENLPGRPRFFVKGGAHFQMFSSDRIFRDGDAFVDVQPGRAVLTYEGGGAGARNLPGDFEGQGSEISARFQDPSWYAGLGVAFSVPINTNLMLYIKPSVQYSVEKIDLPSGLTTVDEPVPMVDPDPCGANAGAPCIREFFIHNSRTTASTTDHSVGAGLEVAMVPFRLARPIRVSLYAEARFLWLVSDDTTEFADSAGVAAYSVVRDDFNIRGGGGLRFSWVGFD